MSVRISWLILCGSAVALVVAPRASAQQSSEVLPAPLSAASVSNAGGDDLRLRIERLEKQNQELLEALKSLRSDGGIAPAGLGDPAGSKSATPPLGAVLAPDFKKEMQSLISDYMKEDAKKKADADAAKKKKEHDDGFVVGNGVPLTMKWNYGPWVESADKAFKVHFGGRTQFDIVGVDAPDNVIDARPGGFGNFDDATNFRRARLTVEGTMWEVFNFCAEYDFLNTFDSGATNGNTGQRNLIQNTPVPTDLWIEWTHIPCFGNLRVGNQKPPVGLEHYTSSRFLNFMERSIGFDAFIEDGNNGFSPGIMNYNWSEDERFTYQAGLFKTTRNITGWNVGDGEWSGNARVGYLAYWKDNGRYLTWIGISGYYRALDDDQVRFRARTAIRNGPAALHTVAAIEQLNATGGQSLINPEFTFQWGPFLFNAEYTATQVDEVNAVLRTPLSSARRNIPSQTVFAQGAYGEMLYFLTGENRDFNRKFPGYGRVVPFRNAFWVPGESGNIFSCGAWQVGARYSWLNLNDSGITGGEVHSATLGLNWFLNPNFKVQWNYEIAHRDVNSPANGMYQGYGVRFALDW